MKFYYTGDGSGKPQGPFTANELRKLFEKGEIVAETPVIEEGASQWGFYRDLRNAAAGGRDVTDIVATQAAKVAAVLQREESRNLGFGLLMGATYILMLPWHLRRSAVATISEWGQSRSLGSSGGRYALSGLGDIAYPMLLLLWTLCWIGDCVSIVLFGSPLIISNVLVILLRFSISGTPLASDSEMIVHGLITSGSEYLSISDFGNRLIWMVKFAIAGYLVTLLIAIIGEVFSVLAGLGQKSRNETLTNR